MKKNKINPNRPKIDKNHFYIVMSCKNVMKNALISKNIDGESYYGKDATYKLLICNFPFIIGGCCKKF